MTEFKNLLVLDFETYYDKEYSLSKLTVPEYVSDARFSVHGLAIRHPDGETEFRADVPVVLDELAETYGPGFHTVTTVCHNYAFDGFSLSYKYGVKPKFVLDTMLLAYAIHGRREGGFGQSASLKSLAEKYGLPAKGELEFMLGVKTPTERQFLDLQDYALNDVDITYQLANKMLPLIHNPEVELPLMQHTLKLFTERSLRVKVNEIPQIRAGIAGELAGWLKSVNATEKDISGNLSFTKLLETAMSATGRMIPLKAGKNGPIPAIARKDEAMAHLLNDSDPVVAALACARIGKKSESQLTARLDRMERIAVSSGGVIPVHLVYYGANTGRWSGGGKFNLQNLGKSKWGEAIRKLIVPREGHVFVIADYAAIEARVNAWFSGQDDLLADFAAGNDVYSAFATETFNQEVRKPKSSDAPEDQKRMKALRQVGKQAVLGLGYGMGALKFMNVLRGDPLTAVLFTSGVLTPAKCKSIVSAFRLKYACIPAFWHFLDVSMRKALRDRITDTERLGFKKWDDSVWLRLPSKRVLRYTNLREEGVPKTVAFLNDKGDEEAYTPDNIPLVYGTKTFLFGGKICENVVQAASRDLLANAILTLEDMGYPVMLHVHDEVVLEVPVALAEKAKADLLKVLSVAPEWAQGLPLAAEVETKVHYGKTA